MNKEQLTEIMRNVCCERGSDLEDAFIKIASVTGDKLFEHAGYLCSARGTPATEFDIYFIRNNFPTLAQFLKEGNKLRVGDFTLGKTHTVYKVDKLSVDDWNSQYIDNLCRYVIYAQCWVNEQKHEPAVEFAVGDIVVSCPLPKWKDEEAPAEEQSISNYDPLNIAGVDQNGMVWTKGPVMVRNYDSEDWILKVLDSLDEEGCLYQDTEGYGWLKCRALKTDELKPATCFKRKTDRELLEYLLGAIELNTGHEPSLSIYQRAVDEVRVQLGKSVI